MAKREVILGRAARKELLGLPLDVQKLIEAKLEAYALDPAAFANMVITLQGDSGLRMRIGDYRVIFELTADRVLVSRIAHRREAYR